MTNMLNVDIVACYLSTVSDLNYWEEAVGTRLSSMQTNSTLLSLVPVASSGQGLGSALGLGRRHVGV